MDILDIFYNNIVPEATTGRINCLSYYNIVFSTYVVNENIRYNANIDNSNLLIPTLLIKDKELFDSLLIQYVNLAMKFYDDSNFDSDILNSDVYDNKDKICKEKVILALLFANASVEDFSAPCNYLYKRIDFICNDITCSHNLGYFDRFNGDVIISIEKDIINNETPYQMIIKAVSNSGDEFLFPRIKLGISEDRVYIYAIQNKENINNSFCKKINRVLYKIGEGYDLNYDDSNENLKDITASFLVALNMCISFLYNNGLTNIVVPTLLLSRWNAKSISNERRIDVKKLNLEEAKCLRNNQDYLQSNLTNKFIRTFLRLGCHYNNIDVLSLPGELDLCLHIELNDNDVMCNNSLLYDTYVLVENGLKGKKNTK